MPQRKLCFVIMPFAKTADGHDEEYWTRHFASFLKPLIEEIDGLEAKRSTVLRGDILSEIVKDLVSSPVVVADLTDTNPNVYWELGVRQSFKRGTVIIAEDGTKVPFQASGKGTLSYSTRNIARYEEFRRNFKEEIRSCLAEPDREDSSVLETISGRGSLFEIFQLDQVRRRLEAVLLEFNLNREILGQILKKSAENQKASQKDDTTFPTYRTKTAAVELLACDRYIERDDTFYVAAETYLRWINTLEIERGNWEADSDMTEKWFLSNEKKALEVFESFHSAVESAKNGLAKIP